MPSGRRIARHILNPFLALALLAGILGGALWGPSRGQAQQELKDEVAEVRIVHGIADAGPLDVYVDGSLALIGLVFTDTSEDLAFPAGDHQFAVVETGAALDDAIAAGTITLQTTSRSYAALLGTLDAASVGIFPIDDRPIDQGRARFRFISGVPDAGEIVPVFVGGDALSEPLGFGDASQYAAIDAGTYDFDILEATSDVSLHTLPQISLLDGTTTDLILVGQVTDASIVAIVESIETGTARATGRLAQIITGDCTERGDAIADLGVVQPGQGEPIGASGTHPVAQGFGIAVIPFAALLATPHAISIAEDEASGGQLIACGEIGGHLTDTGAMVIALHAADLADSGGVAVLAPSIEDPNATGVSIFLTIGLPTAEAAATPAAAIN